MADHSDEFSNLRPSISDANRGTEQDIRKHQRNSYIHSAPSDRLHVRQDIPGNSQVITS